ncbi:hydroxymyristoyl-ACP dehydratase [Pseudomarimonas arenosa]|uniref:Hydroxymyristoyl-ACP dehydratase n=1 Tax=Pseudomarimonas arenosa TaxID=2774145 RepID=A0AAW3ZK42_9GAMM|nr:hydroxymyristoyl-ACP dehydratase [Pseudomarimonas arenosa]MBD8525407.1 hydroxymyristoyl-ACP dehydratase [Pseudomarimonas arenosa]
MSTPASQASTPLCIAADHPCLPGHFPQQPLVPGVLILDRVVAAVRAVRGDLRLCRLPQVKFLRPLLPDQPAEIHWQAADHEADVRVKFEVVDGAQLIARGDLLLRQAEADDGC